MAAYLLLSNIGLIALWLYYFLVLRRTTFFELNRWYLVGAIVFCLLVPFTYEFVSIKSHAVNTVDQTEVFDIRATAASNIQIIQKDLKEAGKDISTYWPWLTFVYFAISSVLLIRLLWSLLSVQYLSREATKEQYEGIKVYKTDKVNQPLSLLKSIYVPASSLQIPEEILLHEKEHINKLHYFDLLLAELATIIFWFNPIVYLYKKSIRLNLEYLADRAAVRHGDELQYQSLLLSHALTGNYNSITTNFFSTPLKKRIDMMKRKNSNEWLRLSVLGVLPLVILLVAMNTRNEIAPPIHYEINKISQKLQGEIKPSRSPFGDNVELRITAAFGPRVHPISKEEKLHKGIDFKAKTGTPVYATAQGEIEQADNDEMHGNYVQIRHSEVYQTRYSHMSKLAVKTGEEVKKGQLIGYVGSTGASTAPHLHYEIYENGKPVDPKEFLVK